MAGIPNGDGDMPDEFMPGLRWSGLPSPGSVPSRTVPPDERPADFETGSPGGSGQPMSVAEQAVDGRNASPQLPGQNDGSLIMGAPAQEPGFTETGAGGGGAIVDRSYRFPWQQGPGGS